MINNFEILPHLGIGNILLGSTKNDIQEQLGQVYDVDIDNFEDDSSTESWIFKALRIELIFDSNLGERVESITSFNPSTTYKGIKLIGLEEYQLLEEIPNLVEDFDSITHLKCYVEEETDLYFWLENGYLRNVTVVVQYDESGNNPIWPNKII